VGRRGRPRWGAAALGVGLGLALQGAPASADPLPSWNDGPARDAILAFVASVTDPQGPDYVPPAERVATFDNDGNLWSEKPFYFQLAFALDRVRALAPQHPEWKDQEPFRAVLSGDPEALAGLHLADVLKLVTASHAGMSERAFDESARAWLATARHPRFERPYRELVFQPMLELLAFLRESGFRTWICSGGGIDFVRAFAGEAYGIPPEQVIGSGIAKEFRVGDGGLAGFHRLPKLLEPINDGPGKPVWIQRHIGRRPILASGNSDGDLQMLQYATSGPGPSLALLLHHDDAEREWAYDEDSAVGRLDEALVEAQARGWTVVRMKRDFGTVYPRR
jgi:phosphoserine phosphatase